MMLFADAIMMEDRSILEFIDADWVSSAIRSRSTMVWKISPARNSRQHSAKLVSRQVSRKSRGAC